MRLHLAIGILVLSMLNCKSIQPELASTTNQPPNLVLILADDLGYGDVGFNGSLEIPTPNIDRIAQEGVTFTNGYVTWAACGPSRAGLITGRYQDRFGFSRNPLFAPNDPNMGLPLSEQTLAEVLGQHDYQSAILGKWHLGAHPSQRPLQRGFTDFYGFLTGGHKYFPEDWIRADEYEVTSQFDAYHTKLLRNTERVEETEYLTDALSREAVNYLEQYKDDPFFIYVAYNAPHGPLQATQKYLDRFQHIEHPKRRTYAAMVSAVDDGVGRILDQLTSLGLAENTIVVFLSDNGGPETKNYSDNGPLRGAKGSLFEGGIRVPFAMRWPKQIEAGITYESPVLSLDIFGSIIAQQKSPVQLQNPIDGVNLIPYITNQKTGLPHQELYWRKHDQDEVAIRQGNTKFANIDSELHLYDLNVDKSESNNQITRKQDLSNALQAKTNAWLEQMKEPAFLGLRSNKTYDENHPNRFERPKDNH